MGGSPVGEYLRARREMLAPSVVGLNDEDGRRVPGLRREEVAALAGISRDYYLRLEQGRETQPSDQVLNALGRALRLDHESLLYLHRLIHPLPSPVRRVGDSRVDESMMRLMDLWSTTPAMIIDGCMDVLVSNPLAVALNPGVFEPGGNLVLSIFAPATRAAALDWEHLAGDTVAALRLNSDPDDPRLHEIVGQLSLDPDFSRLWARHDVRSFTSGTVRMYVPPFGFFELEFQDLAVPGRAGHILTTFFAKPDTLAVEVLEYLGRQVELGVVIPEITELPSTLGAGDQTR